MPPKPPKAAGRQTILDALAHITRAELTPENVGDFMREVAAIGNDRTAAIMLAINLEDALSFALEVRLGIPAERRAELFGLSAPLGTFDYKTRMAHSIGIIADETRATLDVLRRIRNAFAHAITPISFETPQIANACSLITIPKAYGPTTSEFSPAIALSSARRKYQRASQTIAHNLFVVAGVYSTIAPSPIPMST